MKLLSIITGVLLISSITTKSQTVTGSGTASYISKFTGTSTIGNSLIFDNGTNLGINIVVPLAKLDLRGVVNTTFPNNPFTTCNYSTNAFAINMGAGISLGGLYTTSGAIADYGYVGGLKENSIDGNYAGKLVFGTRASGSGATDMTRMTITSTGNIGIGTSSPAQKLEVSGNIRLTDNSPYYLEKRSDVVSTIIETSRSDNTQIGLFRQNGWGDFSVDRSFGIGYGLSGLPAGAGNLFVSGNVGIGTAAPQTTLDVNGNIYCRTKVYIGTPDANTIARITNYALAVNGNAIFTKVKVSLYNTPWADYVFSPNYLLLPLPQVEKYIRENKHLPDVPTTTDVDKDGLDLGGTQAILLQKIEELTLYIIEQNKRNTDQDKKIEQQGKKIEQLEKQLKK